MRRRGNLRFPLLDHVGDTMGELSIIHGTDHDPCLVSALYYEPKEDLRPERHPTLPN